MEIRSRLISQGLLIACCGFFHSADRHPQQFPRHSRPRQMKQWGAVWVQERLLTDLQPLFSFVYHQQPFSPETSRWEKNLDRTSNRSCRQTTTTNNH